MALWRRVMGCPWMTQPELSQAIPPAYTMFVGGTILDEIAFARRAARAGKR